MSLKPGQRINDGSNDLLICSTTIYKTKNYIYAINEKNDDVFFYEYEQKEDDYFFTEVISESLIKDLILHFAKQEIKNKQ